MAKARRDHGTRDMARLANDHKLEEWIPVCIARQATNGDVPAQGTATPLVMAGYLLAKIMYLTSGSYHSPARLFGAGLYYFVAMRKISGNDGLSAHRASPKNRSESGGKPWNPIST